MQQLVHIQGMVVFFLLCNRWFPSYLIVNKSNKLLFYVDRKFSINFCYYLYKTAAFIIFTFDSVIQTHTSIFCMKLKIGARLLFTNKWISLSSIKCVNMRNNIGNGFDASKSRFSLRLLGRPKNVVTLFCVIVKNNIYIMKYQHISEFIGFVALLSEPL